MIPLYIFGLDSPLTPCTRGSLASSMQASVSVRDAHDACMGPGLNLIFPHCQRKPVYQANQDRLLACDLKIGASATALEEQQHQLASVCG